MENLVCTAKEHTNQFTFNVVMLYLYTAQSNSLIILLLKFIFCLLQRQFEMNSCFLTVIWFTIATGNVRIFYWFGGSET